MTNLIKEWRKAWQYNSVQTAIILALANAIFMLLPSLVNSVSLPVYAGIMCLGNIAIVVLRLVAQPSVKK